MTTITKNNPSIKDAKVKTKKITSNVETPAVTKVKKPKTLVEEKVDKANAENTSKKITDKKDLKYIYPEDCTTLAARKTFRQRSRKLIERLEKKIAKLADTTNKEELKDLKAAKAELKEHRTLHIVPGAQ